MGDDLAHGQTIIIDTSVNGSCEILSFDVSEELFGIPEPIEPIEPIEPVERVDPTGGRVPAEPLAVAPRFTG